MWFSPSIEWKRRCIRQPLGAYPLMEPIMTPCTKYFWMKGYTQMMGTVDTTMVEYFMTLAMVCSCAAAVGRHN